MHWPRLILGSLASIASLAAAPGVSAQRTVADSARFLRDRAEAGDKEHSPSSLVTAAEDYKNAAALFARTGDFIMEARVLGSVARIYDDLSFSDSALVYYRRALALKRRLADSVSIPSNLNNLARLYQRLGEIDSARAYFSLALGAARAIGDRDGINAVTNNLGLLFNALGERDSASVYYRAALAIAQERGSEEDEARALNNLGAVAQQAGRPDSALPLLTRALNLWATVGDRAGVASAMNNLAALYGTLARPDSALRYFQLSLAISKQISDRESEGNTLLNIGLVHEALGRTDSALAAGYAAYEIARLSGNVGQAAKALNAIGYSRLVLDQVDSAFMVLHAAADFAVSIGDKRQQAVALSNLGSAYYRVRQLDSAAIHFARALPIMGELENRGGQATLMSAIATLGVDFGMPDTAIADYRRALVFARSANARSTERAILGNIAYTFHRDLKRPNLRAAVAYYDSTASLTAAFGASAGGDVNRLSAAERDVDVFTMWALAWLGRAAQVGQRHAALAALAASERGRAQALLELARGRNDSLRPNADLVTEGERLISKARQTERATLAYLVTPDTLIIWLLLPSGRVLVEREAVTSAALSAHVLRLHASLGGALLTDMRGLSAAPLTSRQSRGLQGAAGSEREYKDASLQLAQILLPPRIRNQLPVGGEVVVIPSGILSVVPFTALLPSPMGAPLGAAYAIRYSPSLAMLEESGKRPAIPKGNARLDVLRRALVVGNPTMPLFSRDNGVAGRLPSLLGAEEEGGEIARELGVSALIGAQATEDSVRTLLPTASVAHLATHGFAYGTSERARDSFVALAPDSTHDGLLRVGELLDDPSLTLRADLVVLSACQTGIGNIKHAEGTVGLQRALLARGARSVLVSLWSVDDEATRVLMQKFYAHWLGDHDAPGKAESLRRAQDDVRSDRSHSEWADARYWAAFQLVGAS